MLNVQEYLRDKTFQDLNTELGIEVNYHPSLPLATLNYSQINSPKTHPIVRECRGLVLNTEDKSLVSRSFPRFFNWGEVADEMGRFQWHKSKAQSKEDGSLVLLYHFNGHWHANTRGSFGYGSIIDSDYKAKAFKMSRDFTWHQAFCRALGIDAITDLEGKLDPACTYVCEFCSVWNKVVRDYPNPCMYLLTRFVGEEEIGADDNPLFLQVKEFPLSTAEDVQRYCAEHPEATFEGIVVHDGRDRWKLKNPRYMVLHKVKGNGIEIFKPDNLLPFILKGETDEICTYFPEVTEVCQEYKDKVELAYKELEALWVATWQIANQKEFALSIVGKTPFTGILFNLRRKLGKTQTAKELQMSYRESEDTILKVLFGR